MSAYTDWPGQMIPIPGGDRYRVSIDLPWEIGHKGSGLRIVVPEAFRHDVSVPRWLTWVQSRRDPKVQKFARIHDWLLDRG